MSRFFFVAKNAFSTSKCFQKVKNQGLKKKTLSALPGKKNINETTLCFFIMDDPAPSYAGYCKTTFFCDTFQIIANAVFLKFLYYNFTQYSSNVINNNVV